MSDIGDRVRAGREALGISQAGLAQRVGTSQQTIDRIERGETTHSRYIVPIMSILEGLTQQHQLEDRLHGVQLQRHSEKLSRRVELMSLSADGIVSGPESTVNVHFAPDAEAYAVQLKKQILGPAGDIVFRALDIVVVDPGQTPQHFDWVLVVEGPKPSPDVVLPGDHARLALVVDGAMLPQPMSADDLNGKGYEPIEAAADRRHHRIVGRYMNAGYIF